MTKDKNIEDSEFPQSPEPLEFNKENYDKMAQALITAMHTIDNLENQVALFLVSIDNLSQRVEELAKSLERMEGSPSSTNVEDARIVSCEWSNRKAGLVDVLIASGDNLIRCVNAEISHDKSADGTGDKVLSMEHTFNGIDLVVQYGANVFSGVGSVYSTRIKKPVVA